MRTAFFRSLLDLARNDARITLIVGDLGFGVVDAFAKELPKQYINAGVAEQNMTGLATGMALSGRVVFTYSIGNFPVMRCLEQIRNDVCYHEANVKIVAVGGGVAYGSLGISHHAIEDLALMRAMPNMTVIAPGDPVEAALATKAIVQHAGPCYLRLGRDNETVIHQNLEFHLGKAVTVREGEDLTFLSTGGGLPDVLKAAEELAREGLQCRVLSMHTLKPIDRAAVIAAAQETCAIFTVEEHSVIGGLGSAVAEILMEEEVPKRPFYRIGFRQGFTHVVGDQQYLRAYYGLDAAGIVKTVRSRLL